MQFLEQHGIQPVRLAFPAALRLSIQDIPCRSNVRSRDFFVKHFDFSFSLLIKVEKIPNR
jgi:hypothetical protein